MITRRLLLILLTSFISSPIVKLYPAGALLLVYAVHDYWKRPYSNERLNFLQSISKKLLFFCLLINMFWAFSTEGGFEQSPSFYFMGELFVIFELMILLLPVLAVFIWLVFKTGQHLYKKCISKYE